MTERGNSKIVICINNLGIGGAERLAVDDINEMFRRGMKVKLLTLKDEGAGSFKSDLKIPDEDQETIHFQNIYDIPAWVKTVKYFLKEKPALLITHLWFANTVGRLAGMLAGVREIISFEHNIYSSFKNKRMFLVDRILQYISSEIIAVSKAVKAMLTEHGIDQGKVRVVLNAIDLASFQNAKSLSKTELGIKEEIFTFLSVGRLINQKGMDILIEAFSEVPNSFLLIAGAGEDEKKLKKQVENLGLEERVSFLGVRQDVNRLIATCDSFVLASRYEGFGIVVAEAMAGGKPIVVSNFEAAQDIVEHGESGIIVPKEDPSALSRAMLEVMNNSSLREKLSRNAKTKSQEFSIENHVNELLCNFQ